MLKTARTSTAVHWIKRLVSFLIVLGCLYFLVTSVPNWTEAADALRSLSPWTVMMAMGALVAGGVVSMRAWVSIVSNGEAPLSSWARVFYVGQLGKYLPGSVWAAAMQARLSRGLGASGIRVFLGFAATFVISILSATVIGAPAVALWLGAAESAVIAGAALVCLVFLSTSPTVSGLISKACRQDWTVRDYRACIMWSLLGWLVSGLHTVLIAVSFGADTAEALLVVLPTTVLAIGVGSLIIIVPGGIGVRELLLTAGLAQVVSPGQAAAIAVLSRVMYAATDLGLAAWSLKGNNRTFERSFA